MVFEKRPAQWDAQSSERMIGLSATVAAEGVATVGSVQHLIIMLQ